MIQDYKTLEFLSGPVHKDPKRNIKKNIYLLLELLKINRQLRNSL